MKKDFAVDDAMVQDFKAVRGRPQGDDRRGAAWTKDKDFIRAMIRYEIDVAVSCATAQQHLIERRPAGAVRAAVALPRSARSSVGAVAQLRASSRDIEACSATVALASLTDPKILGSLPPCHNGRGLLDWPAVPIPEPAACHMRLERLEISGFKSFSDRSELAFDQGVTAIVGPNGCGKSNVADALTWVMGEQSAKSLRGDKMEDVIFSGSDARKPTGAAEVRLRLSGVACRRRCGTGASGHEPSRRADGTGATGLARQRQRPS